MSCVNLYLQATKCTKRDIQHRFYKIVIQLVYGCLKPLKYVTFHQSHFVAECLRLHVVSLILFLIGMKIFRRVMQCSTNHSPLYLVSNKQIWIGAVDRDLSKNFFSKRCLGESIDQGQTSLIEFHVQDMEGKRRSQG